MIRTPMLAFALLLAACAATPTHVEDNIRALEQRQAQAALMGDRAALEKIFAPDFRMINPSGGVVSRDDLLGILASGKPPYRKAVYTTEAVRPYADIVVTIGTEDVEFAATGQPQHRRVTQVWRRDAAGWQLMQRQATLIAAP